MNSQDNNRDAELWIRLRGGSYEAFNELYFNHVDGLLKYGFKITTDVPLLKDVMQELFLEIWLKRDKLSDVTHVTLYLMKSFRYKLLKSLQKSTVINIESIEDLLKEIEVYDDEENEYIQQRRQVLSQLLEILPDRQKEVIHLKYYQNFDNKQISDILNINYQSVSNLLHRALNSIKEKLVF